MPPRLSVRMDLGPMVHIELSGRNVKEISEALDGYEELNEKLEKFGGNLAERVYPECMDAETAQTQEAQK